MADNRKLAAGLMALTPSARKDLAQREEDIQRGKTVELLRRAGKEMYDNPIVNTAIGFTPVLGDIQATGETMAALNRGAPWQETAGYAAGMLPFVPMIGKTVWHGSPHTFDKFDLSKIGTGEGAQAYGHGLYLAEHPATAQSYAVKGANSGAMPMPPIPTDFMIDNSRFLKSDGQLFKQIGNSAELLPVSKDEYGQALRNAQSIFESKNEAGNLYKVDLPDEQIAKMLDWDKPLTEQPHLIPQAELAIEKIKKLGGTPDINQMTGRDLYLGYQQYRGNQPDFASEGLREMGIPGIKYLDQASRGAGEGTRNYVVFSDEIPQILERNNQPLVNALRNQPQLESLNPTGTVMTNYDPSQRASLPLGKNLTTLDVTMGANPDEMVNIYRGVPSDVSQISPGDFITTNEQLAKDYAGTGKVISQKVPLRTILDDLTEPLGEEYIYRP